VKLASSDWSKQQQVYLIDVNGGIRGTEVDMWSSKLSTWLINQAHNLWKAKNEELHRPTLPDNSQLARVALEIQERVRELYEQKDDVNYQDWNCPVESRLQQSVSIMRAWVKSTLKTLGICIGDFVATTAQQNSDIQDYLPIWVRATIPAIGATTAAVAPLREAEAPHARLEAPEVHVLVDASSKENPHIAKKLSPKAKPKKTKQTTGNIMAYFSMDNKDNQQTPKATEKEVETTWHNQQQWPSLQPVLHRRWEVSTGSRVWDAGRIPREGCGGPRGLPNFVTRVLNSSDWLLTLLL
jgi:hypothetical protein